MSREGEAEPPAEGGSSRGRGSSGAEDRDNSSDRGNNIREGSAAEGKAEAFLCYVAVSALSVLECIRFREALGPHQNRLKSHSVAHE